MGKDNQIVEPQVSVFKKITQTTGGETYSLSDVLNGIKQGNWRDKVQEYRLLSEDTEDKEEFKKQFKLSLPNFTGSGVFESKRKASEITQHNGRIFIDLDAVKYTSKGKRTGCIEDGKLDEVRSLICADEYTEYCFESVGGKGLVVVVKIDSERHLESFRALQAYYKNRYGYDIDESCSDTSRPRFVSYDPNLFHNPNFAPLIVGRDYVVHVKAVTRRMIEGAVKGEVHYTLIKASRLMGGYIAGGLIPEEEAFEHLVEVMSGKEGVVSIEIEMKKIHDGIANGKLQPILAEAIRESVANNDKKDEAIKEIYEYVYAMNRAGRKWTEADVKIIGEKYTEQVPLRKADIEKIFRRIFDENKDEFGIDDKPVIKKVEVFLNKHYEFKKNIITQSVEYRQRSPANAKWIELNEDTLYRQLQHLGFKYALSNVTSLMKSDFVREYNPFEDYFKSLPAWDWERDYIGELADYVQTDNQPFFKDQFRKMLVRCVGCSLYGKENRIVMVFVQEQENTGKTSFIRFLSPFGMEYYTEASLHNDKDTAISLSENFIYNLEELDALNKLEITRLKSIISSSIIKERTPWGRRATARPRRCNFFASTNKTEFLNDIGNTRWLCFNMLKINWGYKQEVDINKVWAEALALYHDPDFDCQLTKEEADIRAASNKNYEVNSMEKDLIKRLFIPCGKLEGEFMSNADIFQSISEKWTGKSALNHSFIGKIMVQLGFLDDTKHQNRHVFRGYYVKKVSEFTNDSPLFDQNSTPVGDSSIILNKKAPKLF